MATWHHILPPSKEDTMPTMHEQLIEARKLNDADVRRHASVATDNGPFDPTDNSFTTACELVRRERKLPHLHAKRVDGLSDHWDVV